jgi:GAF domain-containing protein
MANYEAQPGRKVSNESGLTRAQREADERDLQASLSGLAGIVAGGRGVNQLLDDVAKFAAQAIPGVTGAGMTLIRRGKLEIQAWVATGDLVREIDNIQYEVLREGPCITCLQTRNPIISGSLGSDTRWPRFGGRVARLGVHSAMSIPLLIADEVIGVISSYAHDRDTFTEHAVHLGSEFAGPAAVSAYNAQVLTAALERTERLLSAVSRRRVIDQAIGIVRSRTGCGGDEAFGRLRAISQSENVKLHVIAQRLVDEAVGRAHARRAWQQ